MPVTKTATRHSTGRLSVDTQVRTQGPATTSCDTLHSDLALVLLHSGAAPYLCNYEGISPLHCAVQACNELLVAYLLSGSAVNTACLHGGVTPLHLAASLGADRIMLLLLHAGAFVNIVDDYGTYLLCHVRETCIIYLLLTWWQARTRSFMPHKKVTS